MHGMAIVTTKLDLDGRQCMALPGSTAIILKFNLGVGWRGILGALDAALLGRLSVGVEGVFSIGFLSRDQNERAHQRGEHYWRGLCSSNRFWFDSHFRSIF